MSFFQRILIFLPCGKFSYRVCNNESLEKLIYYIYLNIIKNIWNYTISYLVIKCVLLVMIF